MSKKHLVFFAALALAFLCTAVAVAEQDAKEVRAVGVADGRSAKARDEALNDALRKAVEQGVGTFVSAELTVEQQRLVEEKIFTESKGYIQTYRVLREASTQDLYEVEISALVKMGKLSDDLQSIGLVIRRKQNPRVMVVVYSREMDSSFTGVDLEGNRNVENQIESALMQKGFQIVDAGQVNRKKQLEAILLQGDPSRAGKVAKDFGAEILVQGEVRRSFVNETMVYGRKTRFFSNEVRLKGLETDTAKVLYSGFRTRPPSGASALVPLEEASSELVNEMMVRILDQWRKDVFQAGAFQLELSKVSFTDLNRFKEGLKKIRGVSDIHVRTFQGGHALLEVKYQGPLQELAEKISAMRNPIPDVTGLQSNTIEINIRK